MAVSYQGSLGRGTVREGRIARLISDRIAAFRGENRLRCFAQLPIIDTSERAVIEPQSAPRRGHVSSRGLSNCCLSEPP
jgi:hypothetical protein